MIAAFDQWATTHQYNLAAAVLPSAKGSYFSVRRSEFLDSLPSTPASRSCDFAEECFDIAHQPLAPSPIKNTTPKTGRNEPCPCGSGKKYKKCCGG
jgi:preprotein translocase subunit SecA